MSEGLTINITSYPPGCGEATLRQIAPGVQSLILIEPEEGEDGDFGFRMTTSLLELDAVADVLEMLAGALREQAT